MRYEDLRNEINAAQTQGYIRLWYVTLYRDMSTLGNSRRRMTIVFEPTIIVDRVNKVCKYINEKYKHLVAQSVVECGKTEHRLYVDLFDE